MSIRYEITVIAQCSECGHRWTPMQWMGVEPKTVVDESECPRCADERLKAAKLIHHFDEVVDLLN
jgi:hypothetical protein